mgnify:FL=1
MKKKITSKINEKASSILIEWLRSIVEEDEANRITKENFKDFLPKDRYIQVQKTYYLSFYTLRWATQNIKKLVKRGVSMDGIKLEDLEWLLKKQNMNIQSSIL